VLQRRWRRQMDRVQRRTDQHRHPRAGGCRREAGSTLPRRRRREPAVDPNAVNSGATVPRCPATWKPGNPPTTTFNLFPFPGFPARLNSTKPALPTTTIQPCERQNTPGVSSTSVTFSEEPRRPGACWTIFGTTEKSTFASAIFFLQSPLDSSSGPVMEPALYVYLPQ